MSEDRMANGGSTAAPPARLSNAVVRLERFGSPDELKIVDAPLPVPGPDEVRVRVLASSVQFTDTLIRRNKYPHLMAKPPFIMGYDVVGEIDQVGSHVRDFAAGDRVADLTVLGSNACYVTLPARGLTRLPRGVDPAAATTLVLSWTTAYQLLHRAAQAKAGQRVLVLGAAGAVGQALIALGRLAGLDVWGAASERHEPLLRELGATIDVPSQSYDVVFDGLGEQGYRRSWARLNPGGLLCAFGFSAAADQSQLRIVLSIARLYVWNALPNGKRATFYSINSMRGRHPEWFRDDLGALLSLLANGKIEPRVAERIGFDAVAEAHRKLERGGLEGKIVLVPEARSGSAQLAAREHEANGDANHT